MEDRVSVRVRVALGALAFRIGLATCIIHGARTLPILRRNIAGRLDLKAL